MNDVILSVLVFGIPAALGVRSTWHLWRIVLFDGESRSQPLLIGLALIATAITAAAIWFGILTARRLLGFEQLPFAAPVSLVIAGLVLLIPAGIEGLVALVGRQR